MHGVYKLRYQASFIKKGIPCEHAGPFPVEGLPVLTGFVGPVYGGMNIGRFNS